MIVTMTKMIEAETENEDPKDIDLEASHPRYIATKIVGIKNEEAILLKRMEN